MYINKTNLSLLMYWYGNHYNEYCKDMDIGTDMTNTLGFYIVIWKTKIQIIYNLIIS